MKRLFKLAIAFLLCSILCSCNNEAPMSESVPANSEGDNNTVNLHLVTDEDGLYGLPGATAESGYYNIIWNDDGSSNLVFTDFDSSKTVYLSSEVSAYPKTEQDPSWFKDGVNSLFIVEDKLYAVYPGALFNSTSEAKPACIYQMDPDGSNRKILLEFRSGQQLTQSIVTDGDSIYTTIQTATFSGQTTNELVSIDLKSGNMEVLSSLPQGEALVGAFSDTLITKNFLSGNDETTRLSTISLKSLELKEVFSLPFNTTSGTFYGDSYYYIDHQKSTLERANFATGENVTLCENIPSDSKNMVYVSGVWDDYFVYRLTRFENGIEKQTLYGISLLSKEVHENSFTYASQDGIDHSVNIIACAQGKYLYVCDRIDQPKTIYSADGTALQVTDTKFLYALESVPDFWANIDNSVLVEDLT